VNIGDLYPTSASWSVTQASYSGAFSESDNCAGIATITQSAATFTASQITGGTCFVTVTGGGGQTATVKVISTYVALQPQSHRRKP